MAPPSSSRFAPRLRGPQTTRARGAVFGFTGLAALVFAAGVVFWGGFNAALDATSTERFCLSCHEMRDSVYAEYRETNHYRNRSGVHATCPDCHVPRQWTYKVARSIHAAHELYHEIAGTVSTRERFEAYRLALAQVVWQSMKQTDSRECRNCHSQFDMDLQRQDKAARRKHSPDYMKENNKTCIDCHKGVAHHLPKAGGEKSG
jgi:cytochrome c-type protein NapC